jgi:signal transduction histidine kinase
MSERREILDALSSELVIEVDERGLIAAADARAEALGLGVGCRFVDLAPAGDPARLDHLLAAARGGEVRGWEAPVCTSSRGLVTIAFSGRALEGRVLLLGSLLPERYSGLLDQSSRTIAELADLQRTTVRQKLELERANALVRRNAAELAEANRLKDNFLAMLAHELRNPLSAISGAVDFLCRFDDDPERRRRGRGVLTRQTRHLARLINDLLDAARYSRGHIQIEPRRIELADAVRGGLESVHEHARARNQQIELELTARPLPVMGDPERLQQVVTNLLDNAVKYSPTGGRIELRAELRDGQAVVEVADRGEGIAPELQERIFDLFTQSDQSLDRARGGLGIGLTLVRRIVELHGGTIELDSELGRGSTFRVRIPVLEPAGPDVVSLERVGPVASRGLRILVVEDNLDAGELLVELLDLEGHDASLVRDGESAAARIEAERFDIGIFDIGLPGMSGYELARRVRSRSETAEMPLIALTGYGTEDESRRTRDAGFDRHLTKPVDLVELTEAMLALRSEQS